MVRNRVPARCRPALYFESLYNLGAGAFFALYALSVVVITTILGGGAFHLALLAAMFGGSSLFSPLVSYCGRRVPMKSLVVYPNLLLACLLIATAAPLGGATVFTVLVGLGFLIRVCPRVAEMNMYRILYPTTHRGAAVGWVKAVFAVSGLGITVAGYLWFLYRPHWYWLLYCLVAVLVVAAALCYARIPVSRSNVFARAEAIPPHRAFWQGLKVFLADRRFVFYQFGFAVAGTANHMALVFVAKVLKEDVLESQRLDQFVPAWFYRFVQSHWNPTHGPVDRFLLVLIVGFIVAVLPSLLWITSSPIWGRFLDRVNPMTARSIFNTFQCVAYALYAYGGVTLQVWPFVIGAAIHAVGNGGGTINWLTGSLYFARSEHISLYNAVHVCLTGLRGLIAPLLGGYLISTQGPNLGAGLFWIASALSLLGAVIMLAQGLTDPGPREDEHRTTGSDSPANPQLAAATGR